jgi:hypothetical protein
VTERSGTPPPLKEKANIKAADEGGASLKDKLLAQAIIAALAMLAVMAVCFFEFARPARDGLRQALTGETTADGLFAQIKNVGMEWLGETAREAQPAVQPGGNQTNPASQVQPNSNQINPATQVQPSGDVMNPSPAVIGEESKSPVPELPAYPEP